MFMNRPSLWPACARFWLIEIILLIFAGASQAAEIAPKFHFDTAAHAGKVQRLLITADERFIITGGIDHTIRVWDVATGQQLQRWVLPGDDDRIYAMALSPDNRILAVGGDVAGEGLSGAVLLVSFPAGRILHSISGFNARVSALAFSTDGTQLAIGFGGERDVSRTNTNDLANMISSAEAGSNQISTGISIVRVADGQGIYGDALSTGTVDGLLFAGNAQLAVSTHDSPGRGSLAVYRPQAQGYVRQGQLALDRQPGAGLHWSADGKTLHLGLEGSFDSANLQQVAQPLNLATGALSVVRFRDDGTPVAAVGRKCEGPGELRLIRATGWLAGLPRQRIPDCDVNDLGFLSGERVAYVSEQGALALLDAQGKVLWRNHPDGVRFRDQADRLRISPDGEWVNLAFDNQGERREIAFHLETGRFSPTASVAGWRAPLSSRSGLVLLAWQGTATGTANGNYLPMRKPGERTLSALVHSSDKSFFYGTDKGRLYKAIPTPTTRWNNSYRESLMLWVRLLGSDVVAINSIEEKNLLVVATADGLLRLIRMQDGAVVLTYYIEPGRRKWLAVSETGHYEASVGGENLGGWVLNQDAMAFPAFLPLSRFRQQYLLPGLLKHVIRAGHGQQGAALALAEQQSAEQPQVMAEVPAPSAGPGAMPPIVPRREQPMARLEPVAAAKTAITEVVEIAAPQLDRIPPSIELLSPGFEASVSDTQLAISLRLRSPLGVPVKALSSRIISASRTLRSEHVLRAEAVQTINLTLPRENAEIHLLAENAWGSSLPQVIRVRYTGPKTSTVRKPGVLRVLAIGVADYDNPAYQLDLAAKDANDFSRLLAAQRTALYERVEINTLVDKAADRKSIEAAFSTLKRSVRPEDTTFVFLAGHGVNDYKQGYYFMPREADVRRLKDTGLSFRYIRRTLADLPGRNLMFVDTCHAGNAIGNLRAGLSRDNSAAINELASPENNIIVFASSSGEQESIEREEWGNGAFTKALLEGLLGRADFMKRGRVTYKQLDAYVSDRVVELTEGLQTPVTPMLLTVPDFPLLEVRTN